MSMLRPALLSIPILLLGCAADGDLAPMPGPEYRDWGPPMTNTHGLDGLLVSALDTTGLMHDGWRLLSVDVVYDPPVADHPVHSVYVEDGILHGTDAAGQPFSAADFVGSVWTVELEIEGDGKDQTTHQIVEMKVHDFIDDGDRSRYVFFWGDLATPNPEVFNCEQDPDTGEFSAILFDDLDVDPDSGQHFARANTIYFGCISGAIGKAAMWGYSPWATDADMHQTATRVVRADYCGDGVPHTVQGTGLQLSDVLDVNTFADATETTEALWGPTRAYCVAEPRLAAYKGEVIECNGKPLPTCDPKQDLTDWPGTLLWSKNWATLDF